MLVEKGDILFASKVSYVNFANEFRFFTIKKRKKIRET